MAGSVSSTLYPHSGHSRQISSPRRRAEAGQPADYSSGPFAFRGGKTGADPRGPRYLTRLPAMIAEEDDVSSNRPDPSVGLPTGRPTISRNEPATLAGSPTNRSRINAGAEDSLFVRNRRVPCIGCRRQSGVPVLGGLVSEVDQGLDGIATTAETQSQVSAEAAEHIGRICAMAGQNSEIAAEAASKTRQVEDMVNELKSSAGMFRV